MRVLVRARARATRTCMQLSCTYAFVVWFRVRVRVCASGDGPVSADSIQYPQTGPTEVSVSVDKTY